MTYSIVLASLSNCARVNVEQPSSLAASSENYQAIEKGRCTPELDGWFVSREAAERILIDRMIEKTDCELAILNAEQRRLEAEKRMEAAKADASNSRWWATWGFPLGLACGLVSVIAVGLGIGFGVR